MHGNKEEPAFLLRIRGRQKTSNDKDDNNIALEARVIEQEHRFVATWSNFFSRKQWKKDDPRRRAAMVAILWRFVPRLVPATVVVSFGALFTLLFAYKANLLIDVQNNLAEAQRRSSLNIELSAIMDQVSSEVKSLNNDGKHRLRDITEARIIALSRSLEPYRSLRTDDIKSGSFFEMFSLVNILDNPLNKKFLSPERGQILISLGELQANSEFDISHIISQSNFANARLSGAKLRNVDFSGARLPKANLSEATLNVSNLGAVIMFEADLSCIAISNSSMVNAYLVGSNFIGAHLNLSYFNNAIAWRTNFSWSKLNQPDFSGAKLNQANFEGAYIPLDGANTGSTKFVGADLSGTNFSGAWLKGADFTNAEFDGTIFKDADLRGITLGEDFVMDDKKIANISGAIISEDAPENFKSWALNHGAKLVDIGAKVSDKYKAPDISCSFI